MCRLRVGPTGGRVTITDAFQKSNWSIGVNLVTDYWLIESLVMFMNAAHCYQESCVAVYTINALHPTHPVHPLRLASKYGVRHDPWSRNIFMVAKTYENFKNCLCIWIGMLLSKSDVTTMEHNARSVVGVCYKRIFGTNEYIWLGCIRMFIHLPSRLLTAQCTYSL